MRFVGEIIKNKRLAKKIALSEIANDLKISINTLKQIENHEFEHKLYDVFFIGHLRSYSNYLDLNSEEIIKIFKIQNSIGIDKEPNQIPKPILKNDYSFLTKSFSVASIVFIFATFYFLFIDVEKSEREYALIPDLPENYEPIIEKAEIEISKTKKQILEKKTNIFEAERKISSTSVIASSNLQAYDDNHLITLKIINPTWLQLRDQDNEIILSKLMNKNEEFSYRSNLNYSITSGNAGNILVLIDNNVKGRIGDVGEVIDSFVIDKNFKN